MKDMLKIRMIGILSLFSALVITMVYLLIYFNANMLLQGFAENLSGINKDVMGNAMNNIKKSGEEMIFRGNDEVLTKTKERIIELIKTSSGSQNIAILRLVGTNIESEIDAIKERIQFLAESPPFYWQYEEKESEIIKKVMAENKYFRGIYIFNETGREILSAGKVKYDFYQDDFKRGVDYRPRILETGEIMSVGAHILTEDKKPKGYIVADIDLDVINDSILENINLGQEKSIYILDRNMRILKAKGNRANGRDIIEAHKKIEPGNEQYVDVDAGKIYTILRYGKGNIAYLAIIENITGYLKYIDNIKADSKDALNKEFAKYDDNSKKELYRSYNKTDDRAKNSFQRFIADLSYILLVILVVVMCISVLIGMLLANYVAKPINYLSNAAKIIGDGNLDYKLDAKILARKDELGMLAAQLSETKTKLKNNIEHIKYLERRKANTERLSIMGQMVSGIVHEIKNPLTSISGFAQVINESAEDELTKKHSQIIIDETDRLNELTLEMLGYAKATKPEISDVDIVDVFDEVFGKMMPVLRAKNITVMCPGENDAGTIEADRNKLVQVFMNMVSNAVEAMDSDGELTVLTYPKKEYLEIALKDTGPGIPERISEKIFIPFVTTKKRGTGLGLAMVKKIIDDHYGDITFTTGKNGTEFVIKLPYKHIVEE